MKALFGSVIVDGSGGLGDNIISRNRYGRYIRVKPPAPPPNVPAFVPIRDQMELLAAHWGTITESQRNDWMEAARLHPRSDLWGRIHTIPGYNYFLSVNMNRWFCGVATTDDVPDFVPPGYGTSISLTYSSSLSELTVNWGPAIATDNMIKIWASKPLSFGRNYVGQEFKYLGAFTGDTSTSKEFYSTWYGKFAADPLAGKVFTKLSFVHKYGGHESLSLQALCVNI